MLIILPEQEANRNIFSIFFNIKVYCMFSLELPHRGDSNDYTQYTSFVIRKKITQDYPKSAAMGFFLGTQERVRNNRGKRAISVRATEVLLYTLVTDYRKNTCNCCQIAFGQILIFLATVVHSGDTLCIIIELIVIIGTEKCRSKSD